MTIKPPNPTDELNIRNLSSSNVWDFENAFYWFSHPTRLNKLLAHYELYKSILPLPGHILELGVYKGASLIRLATFRALLENDYSRKIIGFDAFGKFPTDNVQSESDVDFIQRFETAGGYGLSQEELQAVIDQKGFQNISLVKGNIFDTLPTYLANNPETRIALLHLDMDVAEPTTYALNELYHRVSGLSVFDDYNAVAGETTAVDEFLSARKLPIEKTPFYYVPAFLRKPLKSVDQQRASDEILLNTQITV